MNRLHSGSEIPLSLYFRQLYREIWNNSARVSTRVTLSVVTSLGVAHLSPKRSEFSPAIKEKKKNVDAVITVSGNEIDFYERFKNNGSKKKKKKSLIHHFKTLEKEKRQSNKSLTLLRVGLEWGW